MHRRGDFIMEERIAYEKHLREEKSPKIIEKYLGDMRAFLYNKEDIYIYFCQELRASGRSRLRVPASQRRLSSAQRTNSKKL